MFGPDRGASVRSLLCLASNVRSSLDEALVERVVDRLCLLKPDATAVLLTGSYLTGTASPASDLDLTVISSRPRVGYRAWFEERSGTAPLHVSSGTTTAGAWPARATIPARWALGLPGA